jgi:hypothetical protein
MPISLRDTNVLEETVTFVFRVEEYVEKGSYRYRVGRAESVL